MKILIIDDEEDIRTIASLSLSMLAGVEVLEASGGRAGLEMAQQEKPDAILLDMIMPGFDGSDTIKALKADPNTAAIPVIFVTTRSMSSDLEKMRILGAAGVVNKPFDPMTLAERVRAILGN